MAWMYRMPQRIWVRAFQCQPGPALDILLPGTACGMPYAPEYGLVAYRFHPLSVAHSRFRYLNCQAFQPNLCRSMASAISRGVRGGDWARRGGATAAWGAAIAARVTAAAGAGPGRLAPPVTRAGAPVVVLARAITAPASARTIGTGIRRYVR